MAFYPFNLICIYSSDWSKPFQTIVEHGVTAWVYVIIPNEGDSRILGTRKIAAIVHYLEYFD